MQAQYPEKTFRCYSESPASSGHLILAKSENYLLFVANCVIAPAPLYGNLNQDITPFRFLKVKNVGNCTSKNFSKPFSKSPGEPWCITVRIVYRAGRDEQNTTKARRPQGAEERNRR